MGVRRLSGMGGDSACARHTCLFSSFRTGGCSATWIGQGGRNVGGNILLRGGEVALDFVCTEYRTTFAGAITVCLGPAAIFKFGL